MLERSKYFFVCSRFRQVAAHAPRNVCRFAISKNCTFAVVFSDTFCIFSRSPESLSLRATVCSASRCAGGRLSGLHHGRKTLVVTEVKIGDVAGAVPDGDTLVSGPVLDVLVTRVARERGVALEQNTRRRALYVSVLRLSATRFVVRGCELSWFLLYVHRSVGWQINLRAVQGPTLDPPRVRWQRDP
jgi:hypothetical protein